MTETIDVIHLKVPTTSSLPYVQNVTFYEKELFSQVSLFFFMGGGDSSET